MAWPGRAPFETPGCLPFGGRWRALHGLSICVNVPGVIQSFADKLTEEAFFGLKTARTRRIPADVMRPLQRKLAQLDAAVRLEDLRVPPGNALEALRGDMAGLYSVRVNDQWRLVFRWETEGPHEVAFTDYH